MRRHYARSEVDAAKEERKEVRQGHGETREDGHEKNAREENGRKEARR